jgi:predicted nuclease with TOPRIM domain
VNTTTLALALVIVVLVVVFGALLYVSANEEKKLEEALSVCEDKLEEATGKASRLESEMSACKGELEGLRVAKEEAEAELRRVRSLYDDLLKNYTGLMASYERLKAEHNRTVGEYTRLLEEFNRLKSRYSVLEENYTALHQSFKELKASYALLEERYERLYKNYTAVMDKYDRLSSEYRELLSSYEELREDYDKLEENYTILRDRFEQVRSEYLALKSDYESLKRDYEELEREHDKLRKDYTALSTKHNKLVSSLENVMMWLNLAVSNTSRVQEFYTTVLSTSVDQVKSLVDYAGFSGSLGRRAFDVFRTLLYWLYYCPDSHVRYVDYTSSTPSISVRDDVLLLPNETWARECGDCEDLALFTYALLKATERPGEKLYLIEFYDGWGEGHVGVLAVDTTQGKYYVVDLAGNYFNGLGVYYRATIVAPNGTKWYYYFSPIQLTYKDKEALSDILEIVYYDYTTGEIIEPVVYYYADAFTALQDWIVDYWGTFPVSSIVVINEHSYTVFTSITDAAKWIEEDVVQGT